MGRIRIGKNKEEFDFKKLVRKNDLSKVSPLESASKAFDKIHEQWEGASKAGIVPGMLCSFHYYEPKTKEELEYYDAAPLTIFFGVANTSQGRRVIGINLHYYPRYTRERIMQGILERYGGLFKSLTKTNKDAIEGFNWNALNSQLVNNGLAFGIRMYIPSLMSNVAKIPVEGWPDAFYTEGAFQKETRAAILKYWRTYAKKTKVAVQPKKKKKKKR